jgi:hypothetical protein
VIELKHWQPISMFIHNANDTTARAYAIAHSMACLHMQLLDFFAKRSPHRYGIDFASQLADLFVNLVKACIDRFKTRRQSLPDCSPQRTLVDLNESRVSHRHLWRWIATMLANRRNHFVGEPFTESFCLRFAALEDEPVEPRLSNNKHLL